MTNTHLRWVTWRWVDPLWWAERQLEATAFMTRLTEAVFDASLTSVCGITGRSIPAPAATVYAQAAEALAATMTAPAAAPAPGPAAAGPGAGMPPWEAAEPQRELVAVAAAPQLQAAVAGVALEAAPPAPQPAAVPVAEQEAAERAPAQEPPVPGWDALTIGSIRARLRRLSEDDLVALHGYEERHAGRPDVLRMLQNRLTKVRSADLGS
jgi:hypothetical protein